MASAQLPPRDFPELVERFGLDFHGVYVESAEGFLAPYKYDDDPEKAEESLSAIQMFFRERAAAVDT